MDFQTEIQLPELMVSHSATSLDSAALLRLDAVGCERSGRLLFQNLSFELASGEGLRLTGSNGSGKTTLLRVIAGLSQRFEGSIAWAGKTAHGYDSTLRQSLLYFGHAPGVKGTLTPLENLAWWQRLHLTTPVSEDRLEKALSCVGLKAYLDTPAANLSAGQQRRVALARLFISTHRLWILDEPFTAIDQSGVVYLEALIAQHMQRGGIVILTTHQTLTDKYLAENFRTVDIDSLGRDVESCEIGLANNREQGARV